MVKQLLDFVKLDITVCTCRCINDYSFFSSFRKEIDWLEAGKHWHDYVLEVGQHCQFLINFSKFILLWLNIFFVCRTKRVLVYFLFHCFLHYIPVCRCAIKQHSFIHYIPVWNYTSWHYLLIQYLMRALVVRHSYSSWVLIDSPQTFFVLFSRFFVILK